MHNILLLFQILQLVVCILLYQLLLVRARSISSTSYQLDSMHTRQQSMHNTTRSMHTTSQTSTRSTSQQYSLLPFPTCARAPSPPPTVAPSPPVGSVSKNATPPCPAGSLLSVAKLSGVGVYDHGCSFGLYIRLEWTALKVVEPFFGLAYIRVRRILIPLRESCTQRVRAENYYVQPRMAPTVYGGAIRFMYCY